MSSNPHIRVSIHDAILLNAVTVAYVKWAKKFTLEESQLRDVEDLAHLQNRLADRLIKRGYINCPKVEVNSRDEDA